MDGNGNILLVRLKSIGDIVFTLPAVHSLRENFPNARITFLVSREYAPLLEGFRDVDEVMVLDRARFRGLNPRVVIGEGFALLRRLRRGKFSLAVDFQGYGETALLTWCSGAAQRWGAVYRPGRSWAYTRGVQRDDNLHPADFNLALLQQCGLKPMRARNEFVLPAGRLDEARRFCAAQGLDPAWPTLFIQPISSSAQKDWPLERYLEVARHWQRRGLQVLFGGGPADRMGLEPAREAGFPVAAGAPLLVSAGLMNLATLVLGSDTGMLHLAVAMNKRVVVVPGVSGIGNCYPFQRRDWVVMPNPDQPVGAITADTINAVCAQAFAELGVSLPLSP